MTAIDDMTVEELKRAVDDANHDADLYMVRATDLQEELDGAEAEVARLRSCMDQIINSPMRAPQIAANALQAEREGAHVRGLHAGGKP